jgi:hypothetical protein
MKIGFGPVTNSTNCDALKYGSAGALLILGLLANSPAPAASLSICSPGSILNSLSSGVCAEVVAQVDNPSGQQVGNAPDNTAASSSPVTTVTTAAGNPGEANATASASPGVLRLYTDATQSLGVGNAATAQAAAGFTDIGTVDKLPGTSGNFGDPVHAIVTVSIHGTTIGIAGFGPDGSFLDIHNINSIADPTALFPPIVNKFPNGSVAGTYEFDTTIGAPISLTLWMEIFAGAGGSPPNGVVFSSADFSNTAELFFDFGTPGFFFNSVSGFNYSSAATAPSETPIPAGLPLMASTIAGAWLVARRRRNKQKASA